jgi:antitoxin (DNA-binding transcriptional repressor) of toxin-antitoxin stability system
MTATVDIEELRHNLSDYLRRAGEGERIEVTDGDQPIAEMAAPVRYRGLKPPIRLEDLPELGPINPDDPYAATRALEEVRGYRPFST